MHGAFEQLGLPADAIADERAIKRAYAQRLKTTRPDEDPEGFQRLREAYEAALLAHARARQAAWEAQMEAEHAKREAQATADSTETPAGSHTVQNAVAVGNDTDTASLARAGDPATRPGDSLPQEATPGAGAADDHAKDAHPNADAPEAPAEVMEIHLGPVFDACLEAAMHEDPRPLRAWLQDEPLLWSLQHKPMVGRLLLQFLDERSPRMPRRNFDSIAEFFGWSDLHTGFDPMALGALRDRLDAAWREWRRWGRGGETSQAEVVELQHTPQVRLNFEQTWKAEGERPWVLLETARHSYPDLCADIPVWRKLLYALLPGHAREIMRFARRVETETGGDLPQGFRRDRVRFWSLAGDDTRWSWPRARLAALRCAVAALGLTLLLMVVTVLDGGEAAELFGGGASFWIALCALLTIWLSTAALKSFALWQARPAPPGRWRRLAHALVVPALALLMWSWVDADLLDSAMSVPVLLIAAIVGPVAWTRLRCAQAEGAAQDDPPQWRHELHVGCWLWVVFAVIPLQLLSRHLPEDLVAPWVFGLVATAALGLWSAGMVRAHLLRRRHRAQATHEAEDRR